jgi:hypothetical protein
MAAIFIIKKNGFLNQPGAVLRKEKAEPKFFAYTMLKKLSITGIIWYGVI